MPHPACPRQADLSCDLLVAGGGTVGLWLARLASERGFSVILCDAKTIGGGASGGPLGALMPHMPERWNPKKQFQFEALRDLEGAIAAVESDTGLATGYRRVGRILPLMEPRHRELARQRGSEAARVWQGLFAWRVADDAVTKGWPSEVAMPAGMVHETLAARVDPRRLAGALAASLENDHRVRIIERCALNGLCENRATMSDGRTISAERTVVAAGHSSFPLLARLLGEDIELGSAVKGQAAVLKAEIDHDRPIIFHDGIYIVPHEVGRVAVGSTSEDVFDDPLSCDGKLEDVITRAASLCPVLKNAVLLERWAGLRPKAIGRDPMIGVLPGQPALVVATGGFKITLGIARRMAQAALSIAEKGDCDFLPAGFLVEAHLEKARKRKESQR